MRQSKEEAFNEIRSRIQDLGLAAGCLLRRSVDALLTGDRKLANETALLDKAIDREMWDIDLLCHQAIGNYSLFLHDLRFISSALRVTVGLERMGDYAVTICRITGQLGQRPSDLLSQNIEKLATARLGWLNEAIRAFGEGDSNAARSVHVKTGRSKPAILKEFEDLIREGQQSSAETRDVVALAAVFNRLQRVGDHARNIAEETIFDVDAMPRRPRRYRVLFVDRKNCCQSQIMRAAAASLYADRADFESAGWQPAERLERPVFESLQTRGIDPSALHPSPLAKDKGQLDAYDVIVSLEGPIWPHIGAGPFHTIVLEWDVGHEPTGDNAAAALSAMWERSEAEVTKLMDTLSGDNAADTLAMLNERELQPVS